MTSNIINRDPYLRTTREFPEELHQLSIECNRAYRDTAATVNDRTIGIYPTGNPAITGDQYFLTAGTKQQSLRKVFLFNSTANINTNIKVTDPSQFIRAFGAYTDGTNCYGLIYGSNVAIAGQISFYIDCSTSTKNIIFETGAGAPTLTSGKLVLEWISSM
jgi:hypothetical protein